MKQGNVGLIFTRGDLKEVKDEIAKYKVSSFMFLFCRCQFYVGM